ncbi:uncharacterized protein V6R79_009073 [Siganus canaliculatus]
MFTASSDKRFADGASQTCREKVKMKKKTWHPEVTLPPLRQEPPFLSAASVARPLYSRAPVLGDVFSDGPLSVLRLPHLVAQIGPEIASKDSKWREGPCLIASALGTDIPIRISEEIIPRSLIGEDESTKVRTFKDKEIKAQKNVTSTKPTKFPVTAIDVIHVSAKNIDLGKVELYYLKAADSDSYRPYDLRVVNSTEAGSEHYIFSASSVLHVTETGYGGLVSLVEWHRESSLWTALQEILFFRNFQLRKTFTWWRRNVLKIVFERKRKALQETLLMAIPPFRNGLFLLTRITEEVKAMHWLLLEGDRTYTLEEFKAALKTMSLKFLLMLDQLSQYRIYILHMVREITYKAHQQLQLHLECCKGPKTRLEPIHVYLAHKQQLRGELARSQSVLQKLGNYAALINHMISQSLVTAIQQDAGAFLSSVLQKKRPQQLCLFCTELCFDAAGQLTLNPPVRLFQEALSEALLTAGASIIQMCDSCGFFLDVNNTKDLTSDFPFVDRSAFPESSSSGEVTGSLCCCRLSRELVADCVGQCENTVLLVQGSSAHGSYYPLSKRQLERLFSISSIPKEAERELASIMQESELEIQQQCECYSWLVDVHLFVHQWSPACLDAMVDQPASLYKELITKLRLWTERLCTVTSISTSSQMFTVQCACIKEALGQQLKSIEEHVLLHLAEQRKLNSERLLSDLEKASAELKAEPSELDSISKYALMVRECVKMWAGTQKRVDYIHSLQDVLCAHRKLTEEEVAFEQKLLGLRDCFPPLLKQADCFVSQCLPSLANTLQSMFSCLVCDIKNVVAEATSGPFLDPNQNAFKMVSSLSSMCTHVHSLSAKLEQLSHNNENLQEHPLDLTIVTADIQKVKGRTELWELTAAYMVWKEEVKQLCFSEVVVSQAQEQVAAWKEKALCLMRTIPTHDAVLQSTLEALESSDCQLAFVAKLQCSTLKHKHRKAIFEGMGIVYTPEKKVTVAELLSHQPQVDLNHVTKICRDAQTERNVEQIIQKLQQQWKARLFRLDTFVLPGWQHCGPQHGVGVAEKPTESTVSNRQRASQHSSKDRNVIITDLELHIAETENDLMTLFIMLKSHHSLDEHFRLEMEDWVQSLQDLGKLLRLFQRYQQSWAFLTKMFHENRNVERMVLLQGFQSVDETFKQIMWYVTEDPHVWNFVGSKTNERFHGSSLFQILIEDLSTMEGIYNQLGDFLETICEQFPRLWFLTDREKIQLLSFLPTPIILQPFVCKCFQGVCCLEVDYDVTSDRTSTKGCEDQQMKVLGLFGSLQEHIAFPSALEPNHNALDWLREFAKHLKSAMVNLVKQCTVAQTQLVLSSQHLTCDNKVDGAIVNLASQRKKCLPVLELFSKYPLQCVLVAEEVAWCKHVQQAFQESNPVKLSNMLASNSEKLKILGRAIRDGVTESKKELLVSKYSVVCLKALVQLTMNHTQQLSQLMEVKYFPLESSFKWLSLMKYHLNPEDSACYVDVLGQRLQYDYEYSGPEDLVMIHSSATDRATLGIFLALKSYRCGFMSGPCMPGKKKTVIQLAKALGRQIVSSQCFPNMRATVVQQMLFGALQTGAWLLLDSVNLLTQGVLSLLGQHLIDIHNSFSELISKKNQTIAGTPCSNTVDPQCLVVLGGKSISACLNYGCVVISSKSYTSDIPESLRCATRPIVLAHPDYSIIAEVMLTSIGFSEAMHFSQRLVCLINMAKVSLCLPDFITGDQTCYLVVLQKIISATEIHLHQSLRQGEHFHEARGSAAEQPVTSSQSVTARVIEKDRTEMAKPLHHSQWSMGLLEEIAVVKAVLSVLSPLVYEHKKALQFNLLFKDMFPIVCQFPHFQQYIEEEEKNQLKDALAKELQGKQCHSSSKIITSAMTLYQTMKCSQAVILLGPSGSGKTTCHSALAGALNHLAAKAVETVFENENMIKDDPSQAEPQISAAAWNSVDTLVLFPNAMSHEELFGFFSEKRGWQDVAVASLVRDYGRQEVTSSVNCQKKSNQMAIVKWLVMDGNPAGQPSWLDYITQLCCPRDLALCLSSGETIPLPTHLKLLMEMTDLRHASPSAVTCCSLVCLTGSNVWMAVWRDEVDTLSSEYTLDPGILKVWRRLSEDLFSSTLSLLKENALTSVICNRESCEGMVYGLQEITSFVRILRALLLRFGLEMEKVEAVTQLDTKAHADIHNEQDQERARNIFVVAYIWGFSGHLHPRHWPQFDLLARQVLFSCRYKIVVPDDQSVFDYFLKIDRKICPKNTTLLTTIPSEFGKFAYFLDLMMDAKQPVLLTGEPGSGKTTLCKSLLSFDKPHIILPASPLLSSRDICTVLKNISRQKRCKDTVRSKAKQGGLLLFVDDLHQAPCDIFGKTSMALETLRQSISKGEILVFDSYNFHSLSSETVSYMATCCIFGPDTHPSNGMSSRLLRLFSIFTLPTLSLNVLLSVHSPRLKIWLKDMPLRLNVGSIACCIISATKDLYHMVYHQFQPTVQTPHYIFSHHDLQKVFGGMCLWQPNILTTEIPTDNSLPGCPTGLPGPPTIPLNIVCLWMHECMRTFGDRLCSEDDRKTLMSLIAKTASLYYGIRLADETESSVVDDSLATPTNPSVHLLLVDKDIFVPLGQNLDEKVVSSVVQSVLQKDGTCALSEDNAVMEHPTAPSLQPHILQHVERIIAKLAYGPETLKSTSYPLNCQCSLSYQIQDLDGLLQKFEKCELVDQKREDRVGSECNVTSRYIIHRQRMSQLLHILRVLFVPGGHGVLIGSCRGTGRKTTVRLAAYVMGYLLMEVHAGNENKLHEILKEADNQTREDGVRVILLVHEGISRSTREELLVAMAHRTYPGLYTNDELRDLVRRVTAVKNSRRYRLDCWVFEKCLSQVHRNVHVFLLLPFNMPDSSQTQLTKALSVSCCVEVYQPWSDQSLEEVAAQCLKSSPYKLAIEGLEVSLALAMRGIHQSACQYASVLLGAQPFSPQTYVEFISHFGHFFSHLNMKRQSEAHRVAVVLSHLDAKTESAEQYKNHLIRQQEKIAATKQREKELIRAVDYQKKRLREAQEICEKEEKRLCLVEKQINPVQRLTVLESRLKIHNSLSSSDLEEVRSYREPPDGVVKIMDAVCLLFDRPTGWESAKHLLGQSNFFEDMEYFNCYSMTKDKLQKLGQIVHNPHFVPESVREVSKACESLCQWVQAVYEHCYIQYQRRQLYLAQRHRENVRRHLEDVKLQLQSAQVELEKYVLKGRTATYSCTQKEVVAAAEQLETHARDMRAAAQETEVNNQSSAGDALLLAAIVSYLGTFAPDTRRELLSKWKELCQTGSIRVNPEDPRTSLFTHYEPAHSHPSTGFPIAVSERLQVPLSQALGMPPETPSDRMMRKLLLWGCSSTSVQHWSLLTDTQQSEDATWETWPTTGDLVKEAGCRMVVCANDLQLLDKLDHAAEKGWTVLVTHIECARATTEFLSRLSRPAGSGLSGLKRHTRPTHPEFCLFLSTHLPVHLLSTEIDPSILAEVRIVDLSLSSEDTQELMLTELLQPEFKNLHIQHLQLQNDKKSLQGKLASEKNALMDYIVQSSSSPWDSHFLQHVATCQCKIKDVQAEIQHLSEELENHEALLAPARQLVKVAASLYQTVQQVSRLSSSYYFSLRHFITVMKEAFTVKGRPFISYTRTEQVDLAPEVTNRMASQLLAQYRPCLTKSHVAVLKLLVCVSLLQHQQLCSEAEKAAFTRGLQGIEDALRIPCSFLPTVPKSTSALPSWIPPHVHPELLYLEEIPAFRGLIASLSTSSMQWQEYLRFPSASAAGVVPCSSHSHLSLLQRALLWKTVLPDCLERLADDMAVYHLCLPGQPHVGSPEALWGYIGKHKGPIILTLPGPRGDSWTSVKPLQLITQLAHHVQEPVEVKVVSVGALTDTELVLSALHHAATDGHWLVFNDCHLLQRWDDKVVTHLGQLTSSFSDEPLSHPSFQMWFITQEDAPRPIPAVVRMCALPLVCDSPWDLTEELSCSLRQVVDILQRQSAPGVSADSMELLIRSAIFHSVLLQRQTYKHQARVYNWSQEDLVALVDAHVSVVNLCHDKTEALQYVAVNLVHGSHVLDSADLEVVESVAKACLSGASPLGESGPDRLLNIIRKPGHFDFTGLQQRLEQGLQDLRNISDSCVLGLRAHVATEMMKINSRNLNTLLQASQTPPGAARVFYPKTKQRAVLPDYSCAKERLQALKSSLAHRNASRDARAVCRSPLQDFLQAEWDDVVDSVTLLLAQLQQSGPYTPPLQLTDLSHLEKRAELLSAYLWHQNTADPPGAYRLAAFKNARGFLLALMGQTAQVNYRYMSDVVLRFQVLSDSAYTPAPPADAVYLCGLELREASWDGQLGALQDTVSLQPSRDPDPLPLVCVRAHVRSTAASRHAPHRLFSHLKDHVVVEGACASPSISPQLPVYHCPLYLSAGQEGGNWAGLSEDHIITTVPLSTKLSPVLCSLRRVRLVSVL